MKTPPISIKLEVNPEADSVTRSRLLLAEHRLHIPLVSYVNWSVVEFFAAVIGDMGANYESNNTIKRLEELVNSNSLDVIIHAGDISYAGKGSHITACKLLQMDIKQDGTCTSEKCKMVSSGGDVVTH